MRLAEVSRMVGGAVVVYVVMAACSARSGGTSGGGARSSSGSASSSGSSMGDGSAGLLDALTDPVGETQAGLPPITATEMCSHTYTPSGTTATCYYAEHAFPGHTVSQLAFVVADLHYTAAAVASASWPTGYADSLVTPYVRDGYAAAFCGCGSTLGVDQVTFSLPQ